MNVQFRGMVVDGVAKGKHRYHNVPFFRVAIQEPFSYEEWIDSEPVPIKTQEYRHYPLRFEDKDGKEHNMDLWLLEGMKPSEALFQIYEGYAESCRKSRDKD